MATSSKQQVNRLAVILNVIAALCSLAMGIPWLIRQTRSNNPQDVNVNMSQEQLHQILLKVKNSGFSSLSAEERALLCAHTSTPRHK